MFKNYYDSRNTKAGWAWHATIYTHTDNIPVIKQGITWRVEHLVNYNRDFLSEYMYSKTLLPDIVRYRTRHG